MSIDPRYPGHTEEFKRIIVGTHHPDADAQGLVRVEELHVTDLMKVRDDELLLLSRLAFASSVPVAAEIARRNVAATLRSIKALGELQANIQALQESTIEAADRTISAVGDLQTQVEFMSMDIGSLDSTVGDLHTTTQAAAKATTQAIASLDGSIKVLQNELDTSLLNLRDSADRWSRWLTRLTIAIVGLTAILVVVTLAPVWR